MKERLRFGYSAWGFLGDHKVERDKEVSTPDGNATYSWSILWEAQRRGWDTYWMQHDRDQEAWELFGKDDFAAFSQEKRVKTYLEVEPAGGMCGDQLPELDVLLVEWRWPIPGRNTAADRPSLDFQPDLDRQTELLRRYKERGTTVILWDLDHKLDFRDESYWRPDAVFETSVIPRRYLLERTRVEPPFVTDDLLQFPTVPCEPLRKMSYVGSRYERDDVIAQYVKPVSERFPFQVEFWGNWTREPNLTECREMWPKIMYCPRITPRDFGHAYGTAACCPLLAKRSYMRSGFVTPRIWESLLFGTIPVGLSEHEGISQYLSADLVAKDAAELGDIAERLSAVEPWMRDKVRREVVEQLGFMDVRNFVDKIVGVVEGRTR